MKTPKVLWALTIPLFSTFAVAQTHSFQIGPQGFAASLLMSPDEYHSWIHNDDYNNAAKREALTQDIYKKFKDDFDFIFFVLNEDSLPPSLQYYGQLQQVSNNVTGIGGSISVFNNGSYYGSAGKLKSLMQICLRNGIKYGPSLHELLHNWANFAIATEGSYDRVQWSNFIPHWGVTGGNTRAQLGGFQQSALQTNINGNPKKYRVPIFYMWANGGNSVPYSQLELYLMGLIPVTDVAQFDVFSGITSYDDTTDRAYCTFTANTRKTYTPAILISELGERNPSSTDASKQFKLLTVALTSAALTDSQWAQVENDARWFSLPAEDSIPGIYNFWEATGGRARIDLGNLKGSTSAASDILPSVRNNFTVYPNPAVNIVRLGVPNHRSIDKVLLYTLSGSLVAAGMTPGREMAFDIRRLNPGTYIFKIFLKNDIMAALKFIKQ